MSYSRPYRRSGLGATDVLTPLPIPGQSQPPIWPLVQGSHGGFMEIRSSPADGACGVGSYPCTHPGVDVNGMQGTEVHAPESGQIVFVADGSSSPVGGYGPWVLIIQGDSGVFHLLGHLDPATAARGQLGARVSAGDVVGTTSSANHTHWEVRRKMIPAFAAGETNATNNLDPISWLNTGTGSIVTIALVGGLALLAYLIWST